MDQKRPTTTASNLFRRILCKGSANMERVSPESENSALSDFGNRLHSADLTGNLEGLPALEEFLVLKARRLRDSYFHAKCDEFGIPEDAEMMRFVEYQMELQGYQHPTTGEPFTGKADLVLYFPDRQIAFIFDDKFGKIPVDTAQANAQLDSYATMFCQRFKVKNMVVGIVQPWLASPMDFHVAEYDSGQLKNVSDRVMKALRDSEEPDAELRASRDACLYCRAKGICREANAVVEVAASIRGSVDQLTIRELELAHEAARFAGEVADASSERLRSILEAAPDASTKYTLKSGRSKRKISDNRAVVECLEKLDVFKGRACEMLIDVAEIRMTALIELFSAVYGISQSDAVARVNDAIGHLVDVKDCKPTVVRK